MSKLLQDELDWIDNNIERYDSPMHAAAVKGNISKRYKINELEREIERLTAQNKALIAAINEVQDLPMHRIDEASFILNQALEVQNAKS